MEAVTTALTSAVSSIATEAMSAIGATLPVALPIMGAMVIVGVGIKVFKKVTNK